MRLVFIPKELHLSISYELSLAYFVQRTRDDIITIDANIEYCSIGCFVVYLNIYSDLIFFKVTENSLSYSLLQTVFYNQQNYVLAPSVS